MAILAWIFGTLGGLCAVMGVITAVGIIPEFFALDWIFWFALGGLLTLLSIASAVGNRGSENYE